MGESWVFYRIKTAAIDVLAVSEISTISALGVAPDRRAVSWLGTYPYNAPGDGLPISAGYLVAILDVSGSPIEPPKCGMRLQPRTNGAGGVHRTDVLLDG